jgi:hypothetical protein
MRQFDLNRNPTTLPDAMAAATRRGQMDAMEMKPQVRSIRAIADVFAPGCANGFAKALKQAYNAGYWAGGLACGR